MRKLYSSLLGFYLCCSVVMADGEFVSPNNTFSVVVQGRFFSVKKCSSEAIIFETEASSSVMGVVWEPQKEGQVDSKRFITCFDKGLGVWDIVRREEGFVIDHTATLFFDAVRDQGLKACTYSPDGTFLLIVLKNGEVLLRLAASIVRAQWSALCSDRSDVQSVEWNSDSRRFVIFGEKGFSAFVVNYDEIDRSVRIREVCNLQSQIDAAQWKNHDMLKLTSGKTTFHCYIPYRELACEVVEGMDVKDLVFGAKSRECLLL